MIPSTVANDFMNHDAKPNSELLTFQGTEICMVLGSRTLVAMGRTLHTCAVLIPHATRTVTLRYYILRRELLK